MDMSSKVNELTNTLITTLGVVAGSVSMLDNIEQIGRIILLIVSICSGILLIAVNWERGVTQFKKWKNKDGSDNVTKN